MHVEFYQFQCSTGDSVNQTVARIAELVPCYCGELMLVSFTALKVQGAIIKWFKFTLKPPYSITHGKLQLAIWDTSFWTFLVKFGHKEP